MALPRMRMSGVTSYHPAANTVPRRPNPVIDSSRVGSQPRRRQSSSSAWRNIRSGGTLPAVPSTGSTITAAAPPAARGQHLGEPLEVPGVLGGVEHAGGEPSRLPGQRRGPARMAVADGGDAHGGGEVEVTPPLGVDEVRTLTVRDDQARVLGDA